MKIFLYQFRERLTLDKVLFDIPFKVFDIFCTLPANCVGLYILIQQFIRIQFRT